MFGGLLAAYAGSLEVDEDSRPGRDAQAVDGAGEPIGCDGWEGAEREAAAVHGAKPSSLSGCIESGVSCRVEVDLDGRDAGDQGCHY